MSIGIPYPRDKTAVGLFHFSLFSLCLIQEGGLFKRAVYLANDQMGFKNSTIIALAIFLLLEKIPDLDDLDRNELLIDDA